MAVEQLSEQSVVDGTRNFGSDEGDNTFMPMMQTDSPDKPLLICGPVCSGKNTALEYTEDYGYTGFDMGSFARMIHEEEDTDLSVSDWAGKKKEEESKDWLADVVASYVQDCEPDVVPAISGIRSPEEIERYEEEFGECNTLFIWSDVFTRYARSVKRGRNKFADIEEFIRRDYNEWQWGLGEIMNESMYDFFVCNMDDESSFRYDVTMASFGIGISMPPWVLY